MHAGEHSTFSGPSRLLIDLAEDRLEDTDVAALEAFVQSQGFGPTPHWVMQRAERIARQHQPPVPARRSEPVIRRLVAALIFDSQSQPAFQGLRAGSTPVRRVLFQVENVEIDLALAANPSAEQVRLSGQITNCGTDWSGGYLRLSASSGEWTAPLDEGGEFQVESLAHGSYRLEVVLHDQTIELPVLPI